MAKAPKKTNEEKLRDLNDKIKASKGPKKCSAKKGFCRTLDTMMEDKYRKGVGSGLVELRLFNIDTAKDKSYGVVYKRDRYDPGLVINFCPWCGNDISYDTIKKVRDTEEKKDLKERKQRLSELGA